MSGIMIEWGDVLSVIVKVAALWVLWQCGSGIRRVTQGSDIGQLVDCLGKLKDLSEKPSTEIRPV